MLSRIAKGDAMTTRRRFLKTSTVVPFISGHYFSGKVYAKGSADLGVAKGNNIEATVRTAVAAVGGMGAFVKKGDLVIVKPNFFAPHKPEWSTITHPDVIRATIKLCLEAGAKHVLVVDHGADETDPAELRVKMPYIIEDLKDTSLIFPYNEDQYEETPIPGGKVIKSAKTAKILGEADVLINLPTAKSHGATTVSLGIKGNLGLIWDRKALHRSKDFHQSLADLGTIIKADLTIVDAVLALLTRGPWGPGKVVKLDTIIAGRDPVAVDSYTVTIASWYNKRFTGTMIKHLVKCSEMGLGEIDPSKLNVLKKTI